MIDRNRLNRDFSQQHNSCVLSSYAIALNYYTRIRIRNVFRAYCNHFSIPFNNLTNAEILSSQHLNDTCVQFNWRGFQMIEYLHQNSLDSVFLEGRNAFSVQFCYRAQLNVNQINYLRDELVNHHSLANIVTNINGGLHAQTIAIDLRGNEILVDTNANPSIIYPVTSIFLNPINECIIYREGV